MILTNYSISTLMILSGTFVTSSSMTWMMAWLGMELNLLGFIPIIKNKNNPSSNEAMMKYFIIQAISSSIFIMASTLTTNSSLYQIMLPSLTSMALLMKIASAPLHFWMISIVNSMTWPSFILLLTWQKIAPLLIFASMNTFLFIFILGNASIGSIMMIKQTSIKKLLAFSSITHLSWILAANSLNHNMMIQYFFMYSLSTLSISILFMIYKINFISHIILLPNTNKILIFMNSLSLMGFPPLLGFLPKISIMMQLSLSPNFSITILILIMFSFISMYSYIRLNTLNLSGANYSKTLTPPNNLSFYSLVFPTLIPISTFLVPPILMAF